MYKRVILKLSGEALSINSTSSFHQETVNNIILQVKDIIKHNIQVSIIVGGGNFWRGRSSNSNMDRCVSDQIGMMGTMMNALYLADSFRQFDVDATIMTPFSISTFSEVYSKPKAMKYLNQGKVIIFAGGIGHPYFSTDTVTALRAAELEADVILFAKNIDGVYDKDPAIHSDAKKFDTISCDEIIKRNLNVIDISAASICSEQKIPLLIFSLLEKDSIKNSCLGVKTGTLVTL